MNNIIGNTIDREMNNISSIITDRHEESNKQKMENEIEQKVDDELEEEFDFSINEVLVTFSIMGIAIGTIIGTGTNEMLNSLSSTILNPVLNAIFGGKPTYSYTINGSEIRIGEFLYQLINLFITFFVVYLVIRFVLKSIVKKTMKRNKMAFRIQKKQNTEIIHALERINENLGGNNNKFVNTTKQTTDRLYY